MKYTRTTIECNTFYALVSKLRPTQLVQLLNSTPLGEVANERTLYRDRARAGLRIGDGKTVDLLRYVAWLVLEPHRPKPEPDGLTGYDAHKERGAQRNRELSLLGRDIGELPAVGDAKVREALVVDHTAGDAHKIGAKVVTHSGYVIFHMPEVAVPGELFAAILDRIQQFGVPPPLVQCG